MTDSKQGTTWFNIDDLMLWEDNPNQGDVGSIITSINEFGYNDVMAVYHGVVMGGNHRIQAVHQLLQGGYVPSERDTQLRAVNGHYEVTAMDVSHLETQAEANAFALALNRTARLGYDDPAMLAALLQDIGAQDVKLMESAGYDGDDLDALLSSLSADVWGNKIIDDSVRDQNTLHQTNREIGDGSKVNFTFGNIMCLVDYTVYVSLETQIEASGLDASEVVTNCLKSG